MLQRCFCRGLGQAVAVLGFDCPSSLSSPVQLWDGHLSLMALAGLVWAFCPPEPYCTLASLMAPVPISCGHQLPRDFPDFFLWYPLWMGPAFVLQEVKIAKPPGSFSAAVCSRFPTPPGIFCSFVFGEVKLSLFLL